MNDEKLELIDFSSHTPKNLEIWDYLIAFNGYPSVESISAVAAHECFALIILTNSKDLDTAQDYISSIPESARSYAAIYYYPACQFDFVERLLRKKLKLENTWFVPKDGDKTILSRKINVGSPHDDVS